MFLKYKQKSVCFCQPIHPFSILAHSNFGSQGGSSLSQLSALDGSPVHYRAAQRRQLRVTPKDNSESPIRLTCILLDSGRKLKYPERPHAYTGGEHANSTLKGPSWDLNQEPSCHEATVQIYSIYIYIQLLSIANNEDNC